MALSKFSVGLPIFCNVKNITDNENIATIMIFPNNAIMIYGCKKLIVKKEALVVGAKFKLDGKTFIINSLDIHRLYKQNLIFVTTM